MKYSISILVAALYIYSQAAFAWNEKSALIIAENIEAVKSHTIHHGVSGTRNIALIKLSGLSDGCTKGVFFDETQNQSAFSIALAAMASKNAIRVSYDIDNRSPWGDSHYCALSGIQYEK